MQEGLLKRKSGKREAVYLLLTGFGAGLVNGLLGAGGGILVVLSLSAMMGIAEEKRDLYANALCVMLPISAVSCLRYAFAGRMQIEGFGVYALPAIAGGVVGGILLGRMKAPMLKKLFGALVIWSGIFMIIR